MYSYPPIDFSFCLSLQHAHRCVWYSCSFVIKLTDTRCGHYPCTGVLFLILVADVYQTYGGPCRAMEAKFRAIKNTLGDPLLYFAVVSFTSLHLLSKRALDTTHIWPLNDDVLSCGRTVIHDSFLVPGQSGFHRCSGEISWTMWTLFPLLRRKLISRFLRIDSPTIPTTEWCFGRCCDWCQRSWIATKDHVQFGAGEENPQGGWYTYGGRRWGFPRGRSHQSTDDLSFE